ncbi:helix-turn-helix domain-containing protein (plasmid) [Haloferax sp. S1W]|uniref:helix-turn-helix domain-containing protein n=1 Tax=Haloferax sp. S1W TaxID=3377110 RepID=UPI0037CC98B9
MHSITLAFTVEGGFHPANRLLAADRSISREGLHYINVLDDGSIVLLYQLRGDPSRVQTHLDSHSGVIDSDVPETPAGLTYIHGRPIRPVRELFGLAHTHSVVFETPLLHTADGLEVTIGGSEQALKRVVEAIPPEIELTLVRKGPYHPENRGLESKLTERQREVLSVAVEHGYYETPRRTTHREIASHVGVTTATVSEHLRKVERHVLSELVG